MGGSGFVLAREELGTWEGALAFLSPTGQRKEGRGDSRPVQVGSVLSSSGRKFPVLLVALSSFSSALGTAYPQLSPQEVGLGRWGAAEAREWDVDRRRLPERYVRPGPTDDQFPPQEFPVTEMALRCPF